MSCHVLVKRQQVMDFYPKPTLWYESNIASIIGYLAITYASSIGWNCLILSLLVNSLFMSLSAPGTNYPKPENSELEIKTSKDRTRNYPSGALLEMYLDPAEFFQDCLWCRDQYSQIRASFPGEDVCRTVVGGHHA